MGKPHHKIRNNPKEGEVINELMKKLSLKKFSTPSSANNSNNNQVASITPYRLLANNHHHSYSHSGGHYREAESGGEDSRTNSHNEMVASSNSGNSGYENLSTAVQRIEEAASYRFLASLSDTRLTHSGGSSSLSKRERRFEWRKMRTTFTHRQPATSSYKSDYVRMHKCSAVESDSGSEKISRSLHSRDLNSRSHSELMPISARMIKIKQRIGEGEFGYVYDGVLLSNSGSYERVALKKLKVGGNLDDFLKEAKILSSLSHPCIVKVYGVCYELKIIALELVKLGSLNKYLRNNSNKLTTDTLKLWSLQIADGMMYLESNKLVHRDLASRNILVSSINQIKISDFGMTRKLESFEVYLQNPNTKIPFRWYPLESVEKQQFTAKSDVWSYGITVWEIFSLGETPYTKLNFAQVVSFLKQGLRLSRPGLCTQLLYNLLLKCWNVNPESRPTFVEIYKFLNKNYDFI